MCMWAQGAYVAAASDHPLNGAVCIGGSSFQWFLLHGPGAMCAITGIPLHRLPWEFRDDDHEGTQELATAA